MTEWNPQANKIMIAALDFGDPAERSNYLDSACAGNSELRAKVESLLRAHQQAGDFFGAETEVSSSSSGDDSLLFPLGSNLAGKYVLRRVLGEGGMGVVLLADQSHPVKREVAIKLIKGGLDTRDAMLRFDQERNALAMMEHPHIAKVYDAGVVDRRDGSAVLSDVESRRIGGIPYFAMEYIPGIPITDYCDRRQLELPARLRLFITVCQAVQHAHQKGIVHRDLKPSNILVDNVDGQPVCKVIDFGLAKVIGGKLTEQSLHTSLGAVVGTLDYMSPEQADFSQDIDTRSDVYALGAVLHELLVGSVPHSSRDLQHVGLGEMLRVIKEESPLAPSQRLSGAASLPSIAADRGAVPGTLVRSVRGDLDLILLKSLEKDRDRRYDSITMMAEDIQRHLNEEPIVARPPSARYRLHKAYRRHRGAFWAAGMAIGLLLLGAIGTSIGFIEASRNERIAAGEAKRASDAEAQVRATLQEVEKQRDEAERQQKIADSISDFLLYDLISQANVAYQANRLQQFGGKGAEQAATRNPTLRQLIDRAAAALEPSVIEKRFPEQPVVQANLLRQMGYAYYSMGEYDEATELLKRSLKMLETNLGANDSGTMAAMKFLAASLSGSRRYREALELRKERLKRCQEYYGPTEERTVLAMLQLLSAHQRVAEFEEGLSVAKKALEICDSGVKLRYSDDVEELKTKVNEEVAQLYVKLRKYDEASSLLESVYAYRKQKLGEHHPITLRSQIHLGAAYLNMQEYERAVQNYEELVPRLKKIHGADHAIPLSVMQNQGMSYQRMGRQSDAIKTFERLIEGYVDRDGPESPTALRVTANLGVSLWLDGRNDEAIKKLKFALERPQSPSWVLRRLCRVLVEHDQADEAERIAKERLDVIRREFPDQRPRLVPPLFALAATLMRQNKYAEAEGVLRELDLINKENQHDSWSRFAGESMLGKALLEQDKVEDSETYLQSGLEGLQSRKTSMPTPDHHYLASASKWLAEFYQKRTTPNSGKK